MALSDKEISALYFEALGSQHLREQDRKMVTRFAHAVESEVRKQDEARILQLVDALEHIRRCIPTGGFAQIHWDSASFEQIVQAAEAGRARLEGKP